MIPRLANIPQLNPLVQQYLAELKQQHFSGDIASNYADRLSLTTDNSVYQQLPQAILFPKSVADVVILTKLAQKTAFQALTFTPRGGGTGTNGQSLNNNIIVDLSRHLTQILELNVQERWVRVQAGVVKDQLNQFLKPHGLFFSPELSTSNRATLGGMINTDASGQGSLQYGKTSDHILTIKAVLMNGDILETQAVKTDNFFANVDQLNLTANGKKLHSEIFQRCQALRPTVLKELPQLNRFLTGYDLKNVFNDDLSEFNLTRILTGSEGSLAFICEAKLNLLPLPEYRTLINIKYNSFDAALRSAPFMLQAQALSVETVDSKVLNLAKQDIVWHSVSDLLSEDEHNPILGINIVEYASNDKAQNEARIAKLCQALDEKIQNGTSGIIGYQLCNDLASIEKIYAMRKKAVGLLGNTKGWAKPIAFVEDTCVPPEHLADYIVEFRQLLDDHGLDYGMFGHVDAGVLHVRPALDLCDKSQVAKFKAISDQVVELTAKYGGLIWGEHGKGMRSAYGERFFGETLWKELRYIKQLFDPQNRLNPGKICTPLDSQASLYPIDSQMRADLDRQIPIQVREAFKGAMNCNGNGLCFNFDVHSTMCPSMKVSGNRLFSPKGRATLVREWLRLLAEQNVSPDELIFEKQQTSAKLVDFAKKIRNQWRKSQEYDFSHEVKSAMDTCLACKACASQCPIKIDVPTFRSQFNELYHRRYLRPLKDYVVANLEFIAPIMAKQAKLFNFFSANKLAETVASKTIGMVDLPALSVPTLQQQLIEIGYQGKTLEELEQLATSGQLDTEICKYVLVVQDPFTSYYDAKVVADFVQLAQKLGFKAIVLPFNPTGKAQHIKGFLHKFANTARTQAELLNRVAKLGIAMVGVDPALTLIYREEYRQILKDDCGEFKVLLAHEWLLAQLKNGTLDHCKKSAETDRLPWHLFAHCTESTSLPNSLKEWQQIFAHFGETLTAENIGCCGMAGTFGHETKHLAMSKGIYAQSWQVKLQGKTLSRCLATGYSCRSQVKRMEHQLLKHPVQALLEVI
ncbi:FAD-binding and (Fe-S)-binding domain-containing protein [Glaesserella parasuis]|uniref:D-2-hydroxyglutarate dehydrogenase YdiJ n=1 Tax=Glaesserella parasuis TaxID=738 RepID=UPI001A93B807|nr:FAD-binding and (Fe-S)-binding domain-containing protein [Glaesserella parasuis]MDO9732781.1 FAD-binding and (Fe-S)-binding domain-containing protein [Glaesserella parasuis]MDO9897654.1 FAD-binding and (Fe-S)-binding domain-containing protein [Glaesserella parasuis]MDP0085371.1 FAD-binding and (Fe-S)-binding domain-containing protein [Glaesserella parasuis]MDP0170607.1 FAD-binding and (Fe-S)-binding domain-containing protein [Glaesserella parasuis]QSX15480.1 FAD-binding oxidoreductase [Glae